MLETGILEGRDVSKSGMLEGQDKLKTKEKQKQSVHILRQLSVLCRDSDTLWCLLKEAGKGQGKT